MHGARGAQAHQEQSQLHRASLKAAVPVEFVTKALNRKHGSFLQTGSNRAAMLRFHARQEVRMATQPTPQDESPRGEDQAPATPDEAGPHDVPDEQVIEHTLPKKRDDPDGPR